MGGSGLTLLVRFMHIAAGAGSRRPPFGPRANAACPIACRSAIIVQCRNRSMLLDDVKGVVGSALQIRERMQGMDEGAPLLGAIPELDSIAVVNLITALEEHFGITVADDEIGAAAFESLGTLTRFVERKLKE